MCESKRTDFAQFVLVHTFHDRIPAKEKAKLFKAEVKKLATISHPNLTRVLGIFTSRTKYITEYSSRLLINSQLLPGQLL